MYILLACESKVTGETIVLERYLWDDDEKRLQYDIEHILKEMLFGVEVQTHWFFTEKTYFLMNEIVSVRAASIAKDLLSGTCMLYDATLDDVSFMLKVTHRPMFVRGGSFGSNNTKRLQKTH